MRPVSAAFLDALTRSHTRAVRADLLIGGQVVQLDGFPNGLPLRDGNVTLDRTRAIRGSCDVTIGAPGLIPMTPFDPVTPFGPELQLSRGVLLSTGPLLASLGIFPIQTIDVADNGGTIQITGLDRAQRVVEADFESTYVVPKGTNYADAIRSLIDAGVPGLIYLFTGTDAVTPLLVFADDTPGSRWDAAQQMATSIGCDLYFDGLGRCVLTPVPDPRADPVVALVDGPVGTVISAGKTWDRAPAYNRVIAYSSDPGTTGPPPRAVATDDDPTSPTFYGGPFGRKPFHYASPLITSTAQAITAAAAQLRSGLGVTQSIDLSISPNPALEPGDIVLVQRQTTGIDEADVIDAMTISLDLSSAMTVGVRNRQVAA